MRDGGEADAASFNANVWIPTASMRSRGFFTHTLSIKTNILTVRPKRLGRLKVSSAAFIYDWPTVVIEQHRPIPDNGLLVDIGGRLGRVAVPARVSTLRTALEDAGFRVVVVRHVALEAPRPVKPHEALLSPDEVPACVLSD